LFQTPRFSITSQYVLFFLSFLFIF
jgi:hypothetical protein